MHPSQRIVNRIDRLRLYDVIFGLSQSNPHAAAVRELLGWAAAVSPSGVPPDTVTMNSIVRLRNLTTGCCTNLALVYPNQPDGPGARPLSVLSPLGAALLAQRVGETIPWHGLEGTSRIVVDALEYQPEREGHYER